jgi:putative N6-adenine-specific DNA methylase
MSKIKLAAVAAAGLEAVVKRELQDLGYKTQVDNGWVYFDGEIKDIPIVNINLRSSDRVMLVLGQFEAYSFEELFGKTYNLPWENWITKKGKFTVKGRSIKSKLYSVPDCQSIVKKAVVEKLKDKYDVEWFEEEGAEFTIQLIIRKDKVTLAIDTTGAREGLFKRGYRKNSVESPIKETMASALIQLSFWRDDRLLMDPMCGSGTIPIEGALIGINKAPGLDRNFASEKWPAVEEKYWKDARRQAETKIEKNKKLKIIASDIDPEAVKIARENAEKAGVEEYIEFKVMDVKDVKLPEKYGILITNPPYGERIGEDEEVVEILKSIGRIFGADETWSNYIITPERNFENLYGKKSHRKRKLYNGNIRVDYYQYYGKKKK